MSDQEFESGFELLGNVLRLRIFSILKIYPELSFTEISNRLNKSKSTLHPHLQKLIEIGLIQTREEEARGSIPRKIYSLTPDHEDKIGQTDWVATNLSDDLANKMIKTVINWTDFLINQLEIYKNYFMKLAESEERTDTLNEIISEKQAFSMFNFLTEAQYKDVIKMLIEVNNKIEKIAKENERNGKMVEKPYYITFSGFNMKRVIEGL